MDERDNTGGPAFPSAVRNWNDSVSMDQKGMTLLDFFAAHAIPAMAKMVAEGKHTINGHGAEAVAASAYDLAEAMLAEKLKREASNGS